MNNGAIWLVLASSGSYLTSFLRERFVYQHEYGTHALDVVVVALAASAIVGNAIGGMLSFWWAAGRLTMTTVYLGLGLTLACAGLAAFLSVDAALLVIYVAGSAAFLFAAQRAAGVGRQLYALVGAITSPAPAILLWSTVGVRSTSELLLGYAVGAMWQAIGAWLVGLGGKVEPSDSTSSLFWPVAYIAAIQIDGVADISLLLLAGRGWASAGAFAYEAFTATSLAVIGPLSTQALAGRLRQSRPSQLLGISTVLAGIYAGLSPLVIRIALHGGAVSGVRYDRVVLLTLMYAPAIPFSIFWQLTTRAEHRDSDRWKSLSAQAALLFLVHLLVLMIVALAQEWVLVPISTAAAFAALACSRIYLRRRDGRAVGCPTQTASLPEASESLCRESKRGVVAGLRRATKLVR